MILKLLHLLLALQIASTSLVIDKHGQRGIYLSDYCPTMKYCPEGTHVLCLNYDPYREYGPRCHEPRNITVTPVIAQNLLDVVNAIRSKIANGKETGKNNKPLPRGYRIFRLKWDIELSGFAQILANQCIMKLDLCRATSKFPDPAQVIGVMKLSYPEWQPVRPRVNSPGMQPGLTSEKIYYIISQILKTWYFHKTVVTPDMLENPPDWSLRNGTLLGRVYMEMIRGASTHMGCGMSAFTQMNYFLKAPGTGQPGGVLYNTVLLVCNFSSQNKRGEPVIYTRHPYTSSTPCGCSDGNPEDSDCLCLLNESKDVGIQVDPDTCTNGDHCENNLVLLPIITIEDAPPHKLLKDPRKKLGSMNSFMDNRYVNRSNAMQRKNSLELFDFLDDANNEPQNIKLPDLSHSLNTAFIPSNPELEELPQLGVKSVPLSLPHTLRQKLEARKESPDVINDSAPVRVRMPQYARKPAVTSPNKKSSIFTRVAKFKLPNKRSYGQYDAIIPDVKPRKDFKNVERIANEYIKQRNSKLGNKSQNKHENKREGNLKSPFKATSPKTPEFTKILNNAEEKIMNYNQNVQYINNSIYDVNNHNGVTNYEKDNQILNLLDNLEKEIKYIELDDKKKEILDAKIKKIYGEIVGLPTVSVSINPSNKQSQSAISGPTHSVDTGTDFIKSDIRGAKSDLKYDTNHVIEDDHRARYEIDRKPDDNKNIKELGFEKQIDRIKNYDIIEQKFKDDRNHIEGNMDRKYNDREIQNYHKSNDNEENKYINNLDAKYGENYKYDLNGDQKYVNMPAPRSQNNIGKLENSKYKQSSLEDRKYKLFNLYRGRETSPIDRLVEIDKNYYRNVDDNERYDLGLNKRNQNSLKQKENEDPLSMERKKYYQEKLANIERRLRSKQTYRRKMTDDRPTPIMMPRMRPNLEDAGRIRPKMKGDSFYVPDRAKFLHGF